VAQGIDKSAHACGPTASSAATLTVLPAGSSLAPAITAPPGDTLWIPADQTKNNWAFQATGNDLQWAYRFDSEPADQWHVLSSGTNGTQLVAIDITPPAGGTSITVRVIDDAAVFATRTWWVVRNHPPTVTPVATPSTVVWPGPVTLGCTATDPDGDALTYTWSKMSGLGNVTFVPNAQSPNCTATFTKFGTYTLQVVVRDGRGGLASASVNVTATPNFDTRADLNNDGVVNALDLGIVLDNFGAAVP
jgi:hypothetical protein